MRYPAARILGWLFVFGTAGWGLPGCATGPLPGKTFAATSTQEAVLRWQQGPRTVRGAAKFSQDADGDVLMLWQDPAGATALIMLLTSDGDLSVSGPLADRSWSGPAAEAPRNLATWITFLTTYQHADALSPGSREIHFPSHRTALKKSAAGLQSLSVANTDLRESLSAVFQPPEPPPGSPRRGPDH